jgi:HEAT repeat protein
VPALDDAHDTVRISAAIAIGELGVEEKAAGPGLVRTLGVAADPRIPRILETAGYPGLAASLRFEPKWPNPKWLIRLRLEEDARHKKTREALLAELEDKDHGEALVAALRETLGHRQDALLIADLDAERPPGIRRAAAILLGHLAREEAPCIEALEKAGGDADQDVRAAAAAAIERLKARK